MIGILSHMDSLILQISCADQPGIVAKVTNLLYKNDGNIIALEQHVESSALFFMRIRVDLPSTQVSSTIKLLEDLAKTIDAKVTWRETGSPLSLALLVSKDPHCLVDLLAKYESGELNCNIPLVISNHQDLEDLVGRYKIPFHYLPINPDDSLSQEKQILELLQANNIDLVVLARYMKILSADFVGHFDEQIINIHHSFLPAFKGSKPYHRAWERGVKVIGATAHYATPDLDEGPIIAQDVQHVSHYHSAKSLVEAGREIEQRVLSTAVKAWLDYRIIVHNRRTIIFHPE